MINVASIEMPVFERPDPLEQLLAGYQPCPPELLKDRALLSRVDSKYVVPMAQLGDILAGLSGDYTVLRVEAGALATYDSLYFDTPDLRCFHDHRRGKRIRHKVRIRHYPDRRLSYLEVKTKRNESRTDKKRMELPYRHERLGPAELEFLYGLVGEMAGQLQPEVMIKYRRLSMIGLRSDERVTIDLGLGADGDSGGTIDRMLGHLAVVEVKQWPFSVRTPIMKAVRSRGHRECSMSKYIVAMALMRPELRRTRLQAVLRNLERI